MIYRFGGEHANHYTTDEVNIIRIDSIYIAMIRIFFVRILSNEYEPIGPV
jgi:hypothetical protein